MLRNDNNPPAGCCFVKLATSCFSNLLRHLQVIILQSSADLSNPLSAAMEERISVYFGLFSFIIFLRAAC